MNDFQLNDTFDNFTFTATEKIVQNEEDAVVVNAPIKLEHLYQQSSNVSFDDSIFLSNSCSFSSFTNTSLNIDDYNGTQATNKSSSQPNRSSIQQINDKGSPNRGKTIDFDATIQNNDSLETASNVGNIDGFSQSDLSTSIKDPNSPAISIKHSSQETCTPIKSSVENQINTNLSSWGLPDTILQKYDDRKITQMFPWQVECLTKPGILNDHKNLVYSAPTSAGKTLVAEILAIKTVLERQKKVIFILPFVSVVREKMFYFQDILGASGVRVEGFMGSYNPPGGFRKVQVAICTIEKANSLINRLLEENKLRDIGAVVVDEMHLLGDPSRGYLLELLLTKLRYMSLKDEDINIQIVGMSATLPNLKLLAEWLDAELFTTDFRPIPLYEQCIVHGEVYNIEFKLQRKLVGLPELETDTDNVLQLCLETIKSSCSVLIFCPTKNWCENLAQQIASAFWKLGSAKSELGGKLRDQLNSEMISECLEQLKRCPVGLDQVLRKTVSFGVAFHHAGLTIDERDIVEGAFRCGSVRVLIATSTLSSGVNLPARRVIIRSPMFNGKPIDALTYRQMIGRAGRMGKDTEGESILICQKNDYKIAKELMSAHLRPIESCLEGAGKLKRAILEVITSDVASSPEEIELFTKCTLLASDTNRVDEIINPIEDSISFLIDNEFIRLQSDKSRYVATSLAKACLSSSLPPEEGLALFTELEKARQCFVLETELHLIYLVTPYSACNQLGNIDWMMYLEMWEKLPASMKRVGELVGIRVSYIISGTRGKIQVNTSKLYHKLQVHKRFYTALALQDLVNEVPLNLVANKFGCNRGMLQSLQQSAATFAGMVTSFSKQLGWSSVEILVSQFQDRLQFGISRDLLDLMKLPLLNGQRARILYNAGVETLVDLANTDVNTLENILHKAKPFETEKEREGESAFDADKRNKLRTVWVTGKQGLTEKEAAELLIKDARIYLQLELGLREAHWEDETPEVKSEGRSTNIKNNDSNVDSKKGSPHGSSEVRRPKYTVRPKSPEFGSSSEEEPEVLPKKTKFKTKYLREIKNSSDVKCVKYKSGNNSVSSGDNNSSLKKDENLLKSEENKIIRNTNTSEVKCAKYKRENNSVSTSGTTGYNDKRPKDYAPGTANHNHYSISSEEDVAAGRNEKFENRKTRCRKWKNSISSEDEFSDENSKRKYLRSNKNKNVKLADIAGRRQRTNKSFSSEDKFSLQNRASNKKHVKCKTARNEEISDQHVSSDDNIYSESDIPESNYVPDELESKKNLHEKNIQIDSNVRKAGSNGLKSKKNPCQKIDLNTKENGSDVLMRGRNLQQENKRSDVNAKENEPDRLRNKRNPQQENARIVQQENRIKLNSVENGCDKIGNKINLQQENVRSKLNSNGNGLDRFEKLNQKNIKSNSNAKPNGCNGLDSTKNLQENIKMDLKPINEKSSRPRKSFFLDKTMGLEQLDRTPKYNITTRNSLKQTGNNSTNFKRIEENNSNIKESRKSSLPQTDTNKVISVEIEDEELEISASSSLFMDVSIEEIVSNNVSISSNHASCVKENNVSGQSLFEESFNLNSKLLDNISDFDEDGKINKEDAVDDICMDDFDSQFETNFLKNISELERENNGIKVENGGEGLCIKNMNGSTSPCKDVECDLNENSAKSSSENIKCEQGNSAKSITAPAENNKSPTKDIEGGKIGSTDVIESPSKNLSHFSLEFNTKLLEDISQIERLNLEPIKESGDENLDVINTSTGSDEDATNTRKRSRVSISTNNDCDCSPMKKPKLAQARTQRSSSLCIDTTYIISSEKSTFSNNSVIREEEEEFADFTRFEIVDVCRDKKLFECFGKEAVQQKEIALSLGCEKVVQAKPLIGIQLKKKEGDDDFVCKSVKLKGLSVCWGGNTAYYVDFGNTVISNEGKVNLLRSILDSGVRAKMFDSKEQIKILKQCGGIDFNCSCDDPKVADWLLEPEGREKNLQSLTITYAPEAVKLCQMAGNSKGVGSVGIDVHSAIDARFRCSIESMVTWHLTNPLKRLLCEQEEGLLHTYDIEMNCLIILSKMELTGFGVNIKEFQALSDKIKSYTNAIETKAFQIAGRRFSFTSSTDVAKVLGIYRGKKISTNKKVLHQNENPISSLILLWRRLSSALTKMVYPLLRLLENGRIYGRHITHSATGRISMQEPNLQNMPRDFEFEHPLSEEKVWLSCRRAFCAKDKNVLVSADYCQLELRLLAHLSQDGILCGIMKTDDDVFKSIAAKWNNISRYEVTELIRQQTKQICYGIIYGMGVKTLADQLCVEEDEALEFTEAFHQKYPGIKQFITTTVAKCRESGYVQTIGGRRRYLPYINDSNTAIRSQAERQAVNTIIQGSAADIVKNVMMLIENKVKDKFKSSRNKPKMVLHLHDELMYEVPSKYLEIFSKLLKRCMQDTVKLSVPFPVKVKSGPTWGDMKDYV